MKNKHNIKSILINSMYFILCLGPLFFFIKDFFEIDALGSVLNISLLKTLIFSLKQAFYSSTIAFIIAIIPAFYISFKRNIITKMIEALLFIPFFFPVISAITIFSIIFNLDFFKQFSLLYSLKAIIIVHVFYNSPIFVKYISEGIKHVPYEIIESFKLDGANNFKIFTRAYLPLIIPQLFKAFILVFTYCLLSFAIILSLGSIKFNTLEIEIASTLMGNFNFSKALFYGAIQFIILILVNSLGLFFKEYELAGKAVEKPVSKFISIFSILYMIFEYSIVILTFIFSFINIFTGKISLSPYIRIFSKEFNSSYPVIKSIINSLTISFVVSFISIIVIYLLLSNYSKFTNILIFANIGISGSFLSISLYYLHIIFSIPLVVLLAIAYLIISIPIGYSFMYQYVKKFSKDIDELSLFDCKNSIDRFINVKFPILKNIFLSAFLQIFAIIFGEFTLSYIMQLEDVFPVASLINYSLVSNKLYLESAAFSSLILSIIITLFIFAEILKNKKN